MRRTLIAILMLLLILGFRSVQDPAPRWKAPTEANDLVDPLVNDAKATSKGQKLFGSLCWTCHGPSGRGDGPNAPALKIRPADLGSGPVQAQSSGALYWKITHGRGEMASYEQVISDEQRWALVHYIRTLQQATK